MTKRIKIAVTGAAGNIGYALLFRLASGAVFGPDVELDLHLLEITPALPSLRGVVMELEDCAFPLLQNVLVTDDVKLGMKEINWAVLVGAMPRKAGMERSDLLQINGGIFSEQGRAINEHADSNVKVLVVGNPCNTNCLIAMNNAPDVPNEQFFAMTMLDQNRATTQLAKKVGINVSFVKNMIIWGNHSSTQYPDFYNAQINGKPAPEIIKDDDWLMEEFIPIVQKRGAEVIKARGASSAASAANAIINSLRCLSYDTDFDAYSMCRCSTGEYGVDEGLIFSFPCQTKKGKVTPVLDFEHNEFGLQKLQVTLDELRHERDAVKQLKLI